MIALLRADARAIPLRDESVQSVVTSPPYWALRKYDIPPSIWGGDAGHDHEFVALEGKEAFTGKRRWQHNLTNTPISTGQVHEKKRTTVLRSTSPESWGEITQGAFCECAAWLGWLGLEPTVDLYVTHMVEVFREIRRVLRKDGTLWLNLGDCYHSADRGGSRLDQHRWESSELQSKRADRGGSGIPMAPNRCPQVGLKDKDLVGIPWRVAFALQADGWWLRSDIVWSKPNPMPESTKDRPTRSHEYLFLMSRAERYYYDTDAIREPFSADTHARIAARGHETRGAIPGQRHRPGVNPKALASAGAGATRQNPSFSEAISKEVLEAARADYRERERRAKTADNPHLGGRRLAPEPGEEGAFHPLGRNKRSVWTVPTQPYPDAHFATFPEDLVRPCVLAGAPRGGVLLDPFGGSGTLARVAAEEGRFGISCDLGYHAQAGRRTGRIQPTLPL